MRRRTRAALVRSRGPRYLAAAIIALLLTLARPSDSSATLVRVPIVVDYIALNTAIKEQLFTSSGGTAELWRGSDACQFLRVQNPRFGRRGTSLLLDTDGELSLGVGVAGNCISPVDWSGIAELDTSTYISGLALRLRITDINLYGQDHRKTVIVGRGFDLVKDNLIPTIETFSYDLGPAIRGLDALVQSAASDDSAARIRAALATVHLEPSVTAEEDGVRLTIALEVPVATPSPVPSLPAAPLTPAEVTAWQSTLDTWDAFFVFLVKQFGSAVNDRAIRAQLANILIDGRERFVQALAVPQAGGPDPVRLWFLDEWNQFRTVIKSAAEHGGLGNRTLEFLSFISAGDALFALDQAAPTLGMRISADDLRRLARIMAPTATSDPLEYNFDEDPTLRKIFNWSAPPESAGPLIAPDESEAPALTAEPSATPSPESNIPPLHVVPSSPDGSNNPGKRLSRPLTPGSAITAQASPPGLIAGVLNALGACNAYAAASGPLTILADLGRTLRGVVVDERNAELYKRQLVRLLTLAAQHEMEEDPLEPTYQGIYPMLVESVAWQESCWRQFVVRRGRVWYLESSTGDIGLMQVNKYVWRGLYSLPRLRWDIVYNTGAGAAILMRLLAALPDHSGNSQLSDPESIARSVYAAYNGGPGAYNRWRGREPSAQARAADDAFRLKFRAMREGQSFDILRCAAEWDQAHGH